MSVKNKIIAGLIITAVLSLAPLRASAFFSGGSEHSDGGAGAGNCTTVQHNGWFWCSGYLAWYYYEFTEDAKNNGLSGSYISAPVDPVWYHSYMQDHGIIKPKSEPSQLSTECAKNSSGFYLSGYVMLDDAGASGSAENKYHNAMTKDWYTYSGLYLSLKRSLSPLDYLDLNETLANAPKPAGIARISIVRYEDVENVWNTTAGRLAGMAGQNTNFNSYTYFCAGDRVQTENYYHGHTELKVNVSDGKGTNFAGNGDYQIAAHSDNGKGDQNATVTIDGSGPKTLYYKSYGYVSQDNRAITANFQRYTVSRFGLLTQVNSEAEKHKDDVYGNVTTDNFASHPYPDTYESVTINPGDTVTICSKNNYYRHIKDGSWDTINSIKSCITVKYDNTKIELGSISQLRLTEAGSNRSYDALSIEGSTRSQLGSKNFGGEISNLGLSLAAQNYGDTKNVDIQPGLVSIMAMNKITREKIVSGADTSVTLRGVTVTNPMNSSNCTTLTGDYVDCYKSTSGWNNNGNLIIYPQQRRSFVAQTKHPAEISSGQITNSTEESSTATINATAGPIQCTDFGNKNVGVVDSVNYGRITFRGSDGIMAGDMEDGRWVSSATKWLAPSGENNQVRLDFNGCMGNQILQDANGTGVNQEYKVTSSNDTVINPLLYTTASRTSYVYMPSNNPSGRNVQARELGTTPLERLNKKYQFYAESGDRRVSQAIVGQTIYNDFEWPNGTQGATTKATLELKMPFNYAINVQASYSGDGVVYMGESPKFTATIRANGRVNKQVGGEAGSAYSTRLKYSYRTITKLYLDADVSASDISGFDNTSRDGNLTESIGTILNEKVNGKWTQVGEPLRAQGNQIAQIRSNSEIEFGEIGNEAVGKKLCIAVAVFPSDSHNTGDGSAINSEDQTVALSGDYGYGDNPKTLFSLSCATVGKKPTTSIEGGSLMAGGEVKAYKTAYHGSVFGSWSEYDLLASGGVNFGSGASFATGLDDGKLFKPQTIGNNGYFVNEYGSPTEATNTVKRDNLVASSPAWVFASDIRARYIERAPDDSRVKVFTNNLGAALNELANNDNELIIAYFPYDSNPANSTVEINSSIINNKTKSLLMIFAERDINIAKDVERVDAFLVADNSAAIIGEGHIVDPATIDTCAGSGEYNGTTYVLDRDNGTNLGNAHLLANCSKQLQINGAVATREIKLDRVYGGGSLGYNEATGDSTLDPSTLPDRAEIFSYDPRLNYWSYELTKKERNYEASYLKELTPRL